MQHLENRNTARYEAADIFKAICIFLVILGHAPLCNNTLKQFIYSFHMPAFFLIYGFIYSDERHALKGYITWEFVLSKIKRLVLPCYICAIVYSFFSTPGLRLRNILLLLWGSQKSLASANSLTSLWFLTCMFVSVIGFEAFMTVQYREKSSYLNVAAMILLTVLSAYLPVIRVGYPYSIDVSMMAMLLILIGFLAKPLVKKILTWNALTISAMALCLLLTCFFVNRINLNNIPINNADMASRNYGNIFLYLICGCTGSLAVLLISDFISRCSVTPLSSFLQFAGKHTLSILLIHKPVVIYLCGKVSVSSNIKSIAGLIVSAVVFLIIVCFLWGIGKMIGRKYII